MIGTGKTVVITGGTRGIGRAIAEHLATLGYAVAIGYASDGAAADATRAALEHSGMDHLIMKGDTRHRDSVEALFAAAAERLGPIYGVIANAGIENVESPFAEMSEADLDRVIDINVKGTFFTLQQAARTVVDGGRIIATGSTIASYPPPGSGAYAASKAAVRLMTEVLCLELGSRQITVNSLDPGAVDGAGIFTKMDDKLRESFSSQTPMGRPPRPADLVGAAAFLLSGDAAMVTGHHLAVTGGFRV